MAELTIGGQTVTIQRFTLVKAMRVVTLLSLIQKDVPEINGELAKFRERYGRENAIELDRVQAKMRYGPQPVLQEDGEPMLREDGEILTIPSQIDRMTEEDWERSGQVLKLRQAPSATEMLIAVFPLAFEKAEEHVLRLLGLITMSNDDVKRYVAAGDIWDRVDARVEEVIAPAFLEEIMELAVVASETIEGQVFEKAKGLGERLGNLRRLLGFTPTTSSTQPTSATSSEPLEQPSIASVSLSPDSSDGSQTESSTSPTTPSTPSESSSIASATASS